MTTTKSCTFVGGRGATSLNRTCSVSNRGGIVSIRSFTVVNRSDAVMRRSGSVDESCRHRRSIVRHRIDAGISFFPSRRILMHPDFTICLKSGWVVVNRGLNRDSVTGALDQFSLLGLLYMHRWCLHGPINSYYSFWWNNLILCRYNVDTLNICMKEFGSQKIILTKWQLWELRQLFPNMAFVYALIVPLWANQLLPQLLMKQFDTLSIQCRHNEHMHEGVYNSCWT